MHVGNITVNPFSLLVKIFFKKNEALTFDNN
jgi:hypothetical protein